MSLQSSTPEEQDALDALHALKSLSDTDGGKQLIDGLVKDILSVLWTLSGSYKELSHTQFIAYSAALSERMYLLRALTNARGQYAEAMKEIEDKLKEEDS